MDLSNLSNALFNIMILAACMEIVALTLECPGHLDIGLDSMLSLRENAVVSQFS